MTDRAALLGAPVELSELDCPRLAWLRYNYARAYRIVAFEHDGTETWVAIRKDTPAVIEATESWSLRDLMRADHEARRQP